MRWTEQVTGRRIKGSVGTIRCCAVQVAAVQVAAVQVAGVLAAGVLAAAALAGAAGTAAAAQDSTAPGTRFVVVLNAAHGGDDAGGTITDEAGKPEAEKNYTLALSVKLRSLLEARGIKVVTTRESDTTLDATRRAEVANHARAQACLSLHASMDGSGVHLFISSLAPAGGAAFVPWKTAQAAWVGRSVALAGVLNSALLHAGLTVSLGRTALSTIDSMTCPAVAVEVAPKRGPGHDSGHDDPAYQARVADALAAALLEWRAEEGQP